MRFDDQFRGQQALVLILCGMGAVDNVVDKLLAEGQRHRVAVDIARLLAVDDEEIVALVLDGDIGVFADLDIAVGARMKSRPSPQVPRPSGVNQSRRT